EPPRRRRARQVADSVVDLEQEGAGEFAHVLEAPLGAPRLAHGGDGAADEARGDHQAGGDGGAVAAHEAARAVRRGGAPRLDGPRLEVAADVLGELARRAVALA